MGIKGLLPFLKNSSRPINLREFSGCTIAVDVYCWLHKGAFGCADKLAQGIPTDGYVKYVMKYVNVLLYNKIKPILVFDGRNLPSKSETEKKRRKARKENREKAVQLMKEGKTNEAVQFFQRCVDITPAMAREVISAARERNIDCIVAPYEADAQLAYLNLSGLAQAVLTEDSDLTLFGCDQVLFKLMETGDCVLYSRTQLGKSFGLNADNFSFEKFRYMCIMAGCDYLDSLPGIGLVKAKNFWIKVTNPDLNNVLRKIPTYLKMPAVNVTPEYIANFRRANETFLHQIVFDPVTRTEKPLTPYPEELQEVGKRGELTYCGSYSSPDIAFQLALGNLDIHSLQQKTYYKPDNRGVAESSNLKYGPRAAHASIWCKVGQELSLSQVKAPVKASNGPFQPVEEKRIKIDTFSNKRKLEIPLIKEFKKGVDNISEDKIAELLNDSPSTPPVKKQKTDYFSLKLEKENKMKKLVGNTESGDTNVVMVSKYFTNSTQNVQNATEDDEEETEKTSKQGSRRTADLPSGSWFTDISRPTSHQDKFIYNLDTPSNVNSKPLQNISNSPPDKDIKIIETPERVRRRNPFAKNITSPLAESPPNPSEVPSEESTLELPTPSLPLPTSQLSLYSMDGDSLTFSQPNIDSQETTISQEQMNNDSQETTVSNDSVELLEEVTKPSPASQMGLSRFSYSGPQQELSCSRSELLGPAPSTSKLGLSKFSYSGPSAVMKQQELSSSSSKNNIGPARVSGLSRNKAPSSLIKKSASVGIPGLKQASLLSMFSRQEKKANLGSRK